MLNYFTNNYYSKWIIVLIFFFNYSECFVQHSISRERQHELRSAKAHCEVVRCHLQTWRPLSPLPAAAVHWCSFLPSDRATSHRTKGKMNTLMHSAPFLLVEVTVDTTVLQTIYEIEYKCTVRRMKPTTTLFLDLFMWSFNDDYPCT